MSEDELKAFADTCFDNNMLKYGFSFTPSGILKAAFNGNELYRNWKERMMYYKPSAVEHPLLYRTLRLFDKNKR